MVHRLSWRNLHAVVLLVALQMAQPLSGLPRKLLFTRQPRTLATREHLQSFPLFHDLHYAGNKNLSLRPLTVQDASFVNDRWPYQSKKSLSMIQRLLEGDHFNATHFKMEPCCWGVEQDSKLVGCILRHGNGALGLLHVENDYRCMGLGTLLLDRASSAVQANGYPLFAYIVDGNDASEGLFSKLGWIKEDPLAKRGTGRRKAKRKWIKA